LLRLSRPIVPFHERPRHLGPGRRHAACRTQPRRARISTGGGPPGPARGAPEAVLRRAHLSQGRERARPRRAGRARHALHLAPEDAILQTAFHVVVNQFGQAPWRGLMDLAVLARAHAIDWDTVATRAQDWRLATASWIVLDMADRLIGLPGCGAALAKLRPLRARRASLRAFMTPSALLSGRDLTRLSRRHVFMLTLVDRPRDGARLIGRTLWPEAWWITARYGRPVSRIEHLWGLVRRGAV